MTERLLKQGKSIKWHYVVIVMSLRDQIPNIGICNLPIPCYPRATRCGGDIVTLLWFRPCVRVSVRVSVTLWPCEHDRNWTVVCLFIKLGRHVHYDERMNSIDFGGQRSKVKVTIDIYGNKLMNTIKTEPLCASSSNLADMFTMTRGWTLLILEVRGQRSRSQLTYMEISLWTR